MNNRFHIAVFNFERIQSFCNNFYKIHNFNIKNDIIHIFDCSDNYEAQLEIVKEFLEKYNLELNKNIFFNRRKNWGIDQGGRLDYFKKLLCKEIDNPNYIFQFQEHFLDSTSNASIHNFGTINIDGRDFSNQVKLDVIPENCIIDLDYCEKVFIEYPEVSVLYANRGGIGLFTLNEKESWFFTHGANFCFRYSSYPMELNTKMIKSYKSAYDKSYNWCLFMEFEYGRLFSKTGRWFDIERNKIFPNVLHHDLHKHDVKYSQNEIEYVELYIKMKNKVRCVLYYKFVYFIKHILKSFKRQVY